MGPYECLRREDESIDDPSSPSYCDPVSRRRTTTYVPRAPREVRESIPPTSKDQDKRRTTF